MKTQVRSLVAVALLATAMIGMVSAATLYVSLESTNPVAPFVSWETAATNIQQAVDAAKAGDTVLVTNGVYAVGERDVGGGNLSRVVITNSIRLESVNGPLATIIDGGCVAFDINIGVRCVYLGNNSVLSGFTLTNGSGYGSGAGVWCDSTQAVLTNCVMVGNSGHSAGGGAYGGTLYNCTLTGNIASGGLWNAGGGAYGCTLYNCMLSGNSTPPGGDAGHGGGACGCTLYNCVLTGNSAGGAGGGAASSTLYNCILTGNSVTGYPGQGGGADSSTLYNCILTGNWATGRSGLGGGADRSALYNCVLTGNSAEGGGGGAESSTLYNCIVYYNTAPNGANYFTGVHDWGYEVSTLLQHSCTTPLPTNGVGNITGPPLFMDMAAGDFRLREDSPCIDAGTNLVGFTMVTTATNINDFDDVEVLVFAYTHDPTDILGNTRFIDGNGDGKVAWDIGAYEFNSFKPPRFSVFPQLTADGWQLSVTGAPNKWVRLQRSGNLKHWEDVWPDVFMGAEGVKQVNDGDTGPKAMFYRVVVP